MDKKIRIGCLYCGKIVEFTPQKGMIYSCPLCNSPLFKSGTSLPVLLTLTFLGLVTFFPAITLPLLRLSIPQMELSRTLSLLHSLQLMVANGHLIIALLMGITLIIIPFSLLSAIIGICMTILHFPHSKITGLLLEFFIKIKEWNFSDVYLLAFFISLIKLIQIGTIELKVGFYFLTAYLLLFHFALSLFSPLELLFKYSNCSD